LQITPEERARLDQALQVAALWLDPVVDFSALPDTPELLTRRAWVAATMPVWSQLAEPVALSISDSLTRVMSEQAPEELRSMIQGASRMMRGIGGALFAMQLGQVVGQLATEVVSGGDIGIPLQSEGRAVLVPQNVAEFGNGLDIPTDQVELYLAVREIAHARLFRHARWLRLHLISAITAFARGIDIDTDRLEQLAEGFDPSNTEELRDAVVNGALIRPKSEAQDAALGRLETMLALVEGWVDAVTADATDRLPRSDAIAESIRRRRASGGPAESAFATLVGLELRPRRLREAAAMWRAVTGAVGVEGRDALWAHPDLLPTSADLDDPSALIARLTGVETPESAADDEFDQALEQLLRGETPAAPGEDGEEPKA
jgi:putative hydrolase